jgi:hypothetical protein
MEEGDQRHAPAVSPPGNKPSTHSTGGWVGSRAGLDGCKKPRSPTRIRSPARPARSYSLYQLSYRGPQTCTVHEIKAHCTNSVHIAHIKVSH